MKLTSTEYKSMLATAQGLPAEARKAMLDTLKSADVVDENGKPVKIEVFETAFATKAANPETEKKAAEDAAKATDLTLDAVERLVRKVFAEAAPEKKAAPVQAIPKADPNKFTIPAEVKSFTPRNFKSGKVNGLDPAERAYRFGKWAMATMGRPDAVDFCKQYGLPIEHFAIEQKLHQENINSAGGFLVPTEFGTDIVELKERFGVFRQYADIVPMSSDTKTEPRRTGGLTAYPVAEGAAGTESTTAWDQIGLTARDWMVLTRVTKQVNDDSIIRWADRLAYECGYAFSQTEDDAGFNGDGTSTYSTIKGVRQRLLDVYGTAGGVGLTVATGTGYATNYNSIVLGDFEKVLGTLPQYADTGRTAWFCHKFFYHSVMEKVLTAAGGNTVRELQAGTAGGQYRFLGYPVVVSQKMPKTSGLSQIPVFLGDLSLAAMFGDRQQDSVSFSEHASVGGQSVFERAELAVRSIERFDINVHDVGDTTNPGPVVGLITATS